MMRASLTTVVFFLLALAVIHGASAQQRFVVEGELWIDGVERGTPKLFVEASRPASIEVSDGTDSWRLEVEVEPVEDALAPVDTLWVHVAVHLQTEGEWERLADSMLGVPEGETATFSIVDDDALATAETAAVFLRLRTRRTAESQ